MYSIAYNRQPVTNWKCILKTPFISLESVKLQAAFEQPYNPLAVLLAAALLCHEEALLICLVMISSGFGIYTQNDEFLKCCPLHR